MTMLSRGRSTMTGLGFILAIYPEYILRFFKILKQGLVGHLPVLAENYKIFSRASFSLAASM